MPARCDKGRCEGSIKREWEFSLSLLLSGNLQRSDRQTKSNINKYDTK